MDLPRAIETLSLLKSQLAYEELVEAKKTLVKFEESFNDLRDLIDRLELSESVSTESISENWNTIKENILGSFE